jgi:hypothetical protein
MARRRSSPTLDGKSIVDCGRKLAEVKGWQHMAATMDSLNPVVTRKLA